jgi:hypothetical protein
LLSVSGDGRTATGLQPRLHSEPVKIQRWPDAPIPRNGKNTDMTDNMDDVHTAGFIVSVQRTVDGSAEHVVPAVLVCPRSAVVAGTTALDDALTTAALSGRYQVVGGPRDVTPATVYVARVTNAEKAGELLDGAPLLRLALDPDPKFYDLHAHGYGGDGTSKADTDEDEHTAALTELGEALAAAELPDADWLRMAAAAARDRLGEASGAPLPPPQPWKGKPVCCVLRLECCDQA